MENTINGRYEIICKLGAGGTSIVYKAEDLNSGKLVAVKVLREELVDNDEHTERFLRESRTLSNLSHPNIVNILDRGQMEDGRYYIVTDYVDGLALKEYIKAKGCLEFEELVNAALQICDGLEHAHDNNIIHRDIKPQNILLSADGVLKITDFGIARALNQNTFTMAGKDVVGSVHYISPEQARGMHLDKRSDIYSFGVVMYEMATGKLPYGGSEAITVAMKHVNQLPRKPKEVNPNIPQCLNDIILKCLAKDPNMRYQDISELQADLEGAAENPDGYVVVAAVKRSESAFRLGDADRYDGYGDGEEIKRESRRESLGDAEEWTNDNKTDEEEYIGEENLSEMRPIRRHSREMRARKANKLQAQKKLRMLVITILLALAVLIVGAVLIVQSIPDDTEETPTAGTEVVVPNVVNKTWAQAHSELLSCNLRVTKVNVASLSQGQQLFISSQNPVAGTKVTPYTTIELTVEARDVSALNEYVKMPNLQNLTKEEAEETLNNIGLVLVKVTEQESAEIAAGKVIFQSVKMGEEVLVGSSVEIVIAKEVPKKILPDLTGKTLDEAKQLLKDNGFEYGGIKGREPSNTIEKDRIYKQEPVANSSYEMDAQVSVVVYVSTGPESMYTANLDYAYKLDEEEESAVFRVEYLDMNNQMQKLEEVTVYQGEQKACKHSVTMTQPAEYTVYIYKNGELYEEFPLYFYDGEGNIAYPYKSELVIEFPMVNQTSKFEVAYFKGSEKVIVDSRVIEPGESESFTYKAVTGIIEVRYVYIYQDGVQYGEPLMMKFHDHEGNEVWPDSLPENSGG